MADNVTGVPFSSFFPPGDVAGQWQQILGAVRFIQNDKDLCSDSLQDVEGLIVVYHARPSKLMCSFTQRYISAARAGAIALVNLVPGFSRGIFYHVHDGDGGKGAAAYSMPFVSISFDDLDISFQDAEEHFKRPRHWRLNVTDAGNPWKEMYTSWEYQVFLRWFPCFEHLFVAVSTFAAIRRRHLERSQDNLVRTGCGKTGQAPLKSWGTPDLVVVVEGITSIILAAAFALGIYYSDGILPCCVQNLFFSQFAGCSVCVTALVGLYYHGLRFDARATAGHGKKRPSGSNSREMVASMSSPQSSNWYLSSHGGAQQSFGFSSVNSAVGGTRTEDSGVGHRWTSDFSSPHSMLRFTSRVSRSSEDNASVTPLRHSDPLWGRPRLTALLCGMSLVPDATMSFRLAAYGSWEALFLGIGLVFTVMRFLACAFFAFEAVRTIHFLYIESQVAVREPHPECEHRHVTCCVEPLPDLHCIRPTSSIETWMGRVKKLIRMAKTQAMRSRSAVRYLVRRRAQLYQAHQLGMSFLYRFHTRWLCAGLANSVLFCGLAWSTYATSMWCARNWYTFWALYVQACIVMRVVHIYIWGRPFGGRCSCRRRDVRNHETDRQALSLIYCALDGPNWAKQRNWLSTEDLEQWQGVNVVHGRVVTLSLPHNRCSGTLPGNAIAMLDMLRWLDLSGNLISGSLPQSCWPSKLKWLDLTRNDLDGSLALSGGLSTVPVLRLYGNPRIENEPQHELPREASAETYEALVALWKATGGPERLWTRRYGWGSETVPVSQWEGITLVDGEVVSIVLPCNGLTGELPGGAALRPLRCVRDVDLCSNKLQGELPEDAFGYYGNIVSFNVSGNCLAGRAPAQLLHRAPHLIRLALSGAKKDTNEFEDDGTVLMDVAVRSPFFMSRDAVLKLQRLPRHEAAVADNSGMYVVNSTLEPMLLYAVSRVGERLYNTHASMRCVHRSEIMFVSHRWYTADHPDDEDNSKLKHIQLSLREQKEIAFVWMDYFSVPQQNRRLQAHVINALPYLVRLCGSFVALSKNDEGLANYYTRGWCQLEMMSAMCPHRGTQLPTRRVSSVYGGDGDSVRHVRPLPSVTRLDPVRCGVFTVEHDRERLRSICERVQAAVMEEYLRSRLKGATASTTLMQLMTYKPQERAHSFCTKSSSCQPTSQTSSSVNIILGSTGCSHKVSVSRRGLGCGDTLSQGERTVGSLGSQSLPVILRGFSSSSASAASLDDMGRDMESEAMNGSPRAEIATFQPGSIWKEQVKVQGPTVTLAAAATAAAAQSTGPWPTWSDSQAHPEADATDIGLASQDTRLRVLCHYESETSAQTDCQGDACTLT